MVPQRNCINDPNHASDIELKYTHYTGPVGGYTFYPTSPQRLLKVPFCQHLMSQHSKIKIKIYNTGKNVFAVNIVVNETEIHVFHSQQCSPRKHVFPYCIIFSCHKKQLIFQTARRETGQAQDGLQEETHRTQSQKEGNNSIEIQKYQISFQFCFSL